MNTMYRLAAFCLFLFFASFAAADETVFEALNADGDRFTGSVVTLDSEKVILQIQDGQKDIPLDRLSLLWNQGGNPFLEKNTAETAQQSPKNVSSWTRVRTDSAKPAELPVEDSAEKKEFIFPENVAVLELRDGSRLVAASFAMKNTTVSCRFLNHKEFSFPLAQLRAVRLTVKGLNDVSTPPDDWQKYAAAEEKSDRLIAGQSGSLDAYSGILQEAGDETVSFSVDGETLPVPRRKVFGILLAAPNGTDLSTKNTNSSGSVKLWNGSILVLRSLKTNESGAVEWTTLSGISGSSGYAEIEQFDFGRKNASYLSELPFVWKEQSVFFGSHPSGSSPAELFLQFRANRINVTKTHLPMITPVISGDSRQQVPDRPLPNLQGFQLNGTIYEHGLTLPAQTVLEYTLPESFQSLRFVAGIDDRLRPNGRVLLRIQSEGQLLLETVIQGSQPAIRKELNIAGMKKITIFAEYPGGFSEPAILTLGDVKLVK